MKLDCRKAEAKITQAGLVVCLWCGRPLTGRAYKPRHAPGYPRAWPDPRKVKHGT